MRVTRNWFAMKLEQEKLRNLLTDTILLLCNNGLKFKQELKVEGLIGITVDSEEVFLVHLNESRKGKDATTGGLVHSTTSGDKEGHVSSDSEGSPSTKRRRRKRKSTPSHLSLKELQVDPQASTSALNNPFFPLLKIKKEKEDCDFNNGDGDGAAAAIEFPGNESPDESSTNLAGKSNSSDLSCMMTSDSLAPLSTSNQGNWIEGDVPGRLQLFPEWSPQSLQALSVAQQATSSEGSPAQNDKQVPQKKDANLPSGKMSSWFQRQALTEAFVTPLLDKPNIRVEAFRIIWRHTGTALEDSWGKIVPFRNETDDMVSTYLGVDLFISCITGVFSKPNKSMKGVQPPTQLQPTVYPAVAYWLVSSAPNFDAKDLRSYLGESFPDTNIKPILVNSIDNEESMVTSLCAVLKDHGHPYITRRIETSQRTYCPEETTLEAFYPGRVILQSPQHFGTILNTAKEALTNRKINLWFQNKSK